MPYARELEALRRAGRFRSRRLFDDSLIDFASNDYLGLASKKSALRRACRLLERYPVHASRASMLVNGYHPIHEVFENEIARLNGFGAGLVVGSGFLANLALIEALVRRGDRLFYDEEFHASGRLAARLLGDRAIPFAHNDPEDLRRKLRRFGGKGRRIVAIEGVYSMSGDLAARGIFDAAEEEADLLIVDEAHSSGVLGDRLLGIFEHYGIVPHEGHIKMGTLGKAYGSYGAYILASPSIVSYLENRGKPVIYSTAPSVFDTALALVNLRRITRKAPTLREKLAKRRRIVREITGISVSSQIVPYPVGSDREALTLQRKLEEKGWLVGAIRRPTVERPILRIIPRLGAKASQLRRMLHDLVELHG